MTQYDINLREYWRILRKRRFIVILIATVVGVFSTAFAILRAPTPIYTSACRIMFERQTPVQGVYDRTISWSSNEHIEARIPRIKSYSVFQKVAERLKLIPNSTKSEGNPLKPNIIGVIDDLLVKVEVTRDSYTTSDFNTNILNIEVTDPSPAFAQKLASTVASTFKELHAERQTKRATEAVRYIEQQLQGMRQKLRESEDRFNRFCQDNQLISIDLQSENLLALGQEIQYTIRRLHKDKRELEGILLRLNQFLENPFKSNRMFYSKKADDEYQATNDILVGLRLKRDTLLEDYTLQHPEVVAITRKVIENARKMKIQLQLHISNMEDKGADLGEDLEEVGRKTNVLVDKKLEFNHLRRKVESHTRMTAHLEEKSQEALIRKAEKPEEITILRPAPLPAKPNNPPRTATTGVIGVIIGLILGMVIAFVVETFDTSLGTIEDIEKTLGTQVMGVISHADERDILERLKNKYSEKAYESFMKHAIYFMSPLIPQSIAVENFRVLRTNIQFKCMKENIKTIAIASASPQEGKTVIAMNLAVTLVQADAKVLLVGSDLRRPVLSKAFGVDRALGLTDFLRGACPWRDTVSSFADMMSAKMTPDELSNTRGLDNLHVITSGPIPTHPAELINSSRMAELIEEAKQEYDIVLFDSTPILSTADAAILGTKVDGVLVVYRLGKVSRGLLKRSTNLLEQVNCRIIGTILNDMRPELSPDFHDYKYYRQYYSYGEEDKRESRGEHEKGIALLRKNPGNQKKANRRFRSNKEEGGVQKLDKHRSVLRLPLMGVTLALLTAGSLLQNVTLERPGKEDATKPFIIKSIESVKNPQHEAKKPVAKSQPGAKDAKELEKDSETDTPTKKISSHPLSVRLGSFASLDRVKKAVVLVLSAYGTKVDFSQGLRSPVFPGHFEDPERAKRFKQEHGLTKAAASEKKYANLIATYTSPDELENRILLLKSLGYSPYVIKDHDGKSRLFVGAFLTKAGAERQYQDLKSLGIETQAVKR